MKELQSSASVDLSVLIPVLNEELLLPRALESAKRLGVKVYILDSGSTDRTLEIARSYGCEVHQGRWGSFGEKLNWGFNELSFETSWVMRLDADEYFTDELIKQLQDGALAKLNQSIDGVWIGRQIYFMGKRIRFGGMNSQPHVRIVRPGKARYEYRLTDEHVVVDGGFASINAAVVDDPAKGLVFWLKKHIAYAETECYAAYHIKAGTSWRTLHGSAKFRRFLKEEIYSRFPLFIRPLGFWVYRYVFLLGFLDGYRGLIFHFLHAFWYRFVIDAMIFESRITKGASVKSEHSY